MSNIDTEKNITALELILENCEKIRFPAKYIKWLSVEDVSRGFNYSNGSYNEHIKANEVTITINTNANTADAYSDDFPLPERKLPFDRIIRHNDITHIEVAYNDNTTEYISVSWEDNEDNEDININQASSLNFCDDLSISISPKNNDF